MALYNHVSVSPNSNSVLIKAHNMTLSQLLKTIYTVYKMSTHKIK